MDTRWIELCRDGDSLAIERLVRTYQQNVYRLALSILDDPDEAEDGMQDAFLAALRELYSFRGDSSFSTWLYAITINICRTRLRSRKTRERLKQVVQGLFHLHGNGATSVEESVIQNESNADVWQAIRTIDDKHRLPIILRYYHNFSVAEIAEILGIPQGTVHSRLNNARERLRKTLKEGQK